MKIHNEDILLKEDDNRYVMFPIVDQDIWKMYKKQVDCFWRTEEIDLSKDLDQWNKLSDDEKKQVEDAVVSLEESISSEDLEAIESATKNLNDVLTPLTQKLYKQESSEGQDNTDSGSEDVSDNTVDAEFEEVKEEEKE